LAVEVGPAGEEALGLSEAWLRGVWEWRGWFVLLLSGCEHTREEYEKRAEMDEGSDALGIIV